MKIADVDDKRRVIKNLDKKSMMIFLLEECNFSCEHCVREEEPMSSGYKLSFQQLVECLRDCQKLKTIEWVHFSGGEPTLWREGKRELTDLLIEISQAGFTPGFTTNGSYFTDYTNCENFLNRYFDNANKTLKFYISIDTFHRNYDAIKGRAKSLDNILKYKMKLSPESKDFLNITILVTVSKDKESLLPENMIDHYKSQGVKFTFIPLGLKGRAKSIGHLCPILESKDPEGMGAYYPFHKKKEELEVKSNIILIGEDYYIYNIDSRLEFTQRWRKVSQLGNLILDIWV